ncbi:MAG: N,N-dimethylformamidase beta subunit family domain-containing protein [Pseudomonadota bacterium]
MQRYPFGRKDLAAYTDAMAVRAGDAIAVRASAHYTGQYRADLVQILCGDDRPRGTGFDVRPVDLGPQAPTGELGTYPARSQPVVDGSWGLVKELPGFETLTLTFKAYPTTPERAACLLSGPGFEVSQRFGRLEVRTDAGAVVVLSEYLAARRWHEIEITVAADGALGVYVRCAGVGLGEPVVRWEERGAAEADIPVTAAVSAGPWRLARGAGEAQPTFNGRLEAPRWHADALVAGWDFSAQMAAQTLADLTGNHELILYQHPARAVQGSVWDGSVTDWRSDPRHYAAVHFHEDDLTDAGWDADFEFSLPSLLPSGVYAVRLQPLPDHPPVDEVTLVDEYVPLFVRPGEGAATAPLAFLASTATYLAYGNQRLAAAAVVGGKAPRNPNDLYLLDHPELGNSLYEHHPDGDGVRYASGRRPMLNCRPGSIMWSFNADTNLLAWLAAIDRPFDIVTDHDLHARGADALAPYRAVITGTHPEYYSSAMMTGLADWLDDGGRLMYMGGNGFYWRIAFDPEDDQVIEVRRAEDGTRAWIAEPGEYHHSFTGELGGLWRRLGRPPNHLVGIGFTAQGFDGGTHYRFNAAAADPRVAFAVDGVDLSQPFGAHGTQGGGAAGEEIDRFDLRQGSPPHAVVIASSEGHRPGMLLAKEEYRMMEPPQPEDGRIRADLTFFETRAGGAVFSTGSISYAGALSTDGYDNDVARLTGNVLERFLDPAPFALPD